MDVTRIYGSGKNEDKYISFGADPKILLRDYDAYVKYVKGCEHAVRKDDRYTHYVGKVRSSGFDHCAVIGHVNEDTNSVKLEMHHGVIFNLFDYCDIVLKACLKRGEIPELTTFDVADLVLTEHELGNVGIVMLNETAHKAAHNTMFIDIRATTGRVDRFIDRWTDGMEKDHWEMIDKYLKEYEKARSTIDNGLFDTEEKLRSFR